MPRVRRFRRSEEHRHSFSRKIAMRSLSITALAGVALVLLPLAAARAQPVQVFILAGQSNMEGQAVVDLDGKNYNGGKGTLKALLRDQPRLVKHPGDDQGEGGGRQGGG